MEGNAQNGNMHGTEIRHGKGYHLPASLLERRVSFMFMGEYNHTIDTKNRLIIPSKFREALGDEFVVTKGLDGCLFVYDKIGRAHV